MSGGYAFGRRSKGNLVGVDPGIIAVAHYAIRHCESDFSVFEGVRNDRRQAHLVSIGASKTLNSYHLYGLAVDLVPYFQGRNWWDSANQAIQKRIDQAFIDIHTAVMDACNVVGVALDNGYDMWGWDKPHYQRTGHKYRYDIRTLPHILGTL